MFLQRGLVGRVMFHEVVPPVEGLTALDADMRLVASVYDKVTSKVLRPLEALGTDGTHVRSIVRVAVQVPLQMLLPLVTSSANTADEPPLPLGQDSTAGISHITSETFECFGSQI